MLFRLFSAIQSYSRYSRTRMSRRFLIQGISYTRMRTRNAAVEVHEVGEPTAQPVAPEELPTRRTTLNPKP